MITEADIAPLGEDGSPTPYAELAAVLDALPLLVREARRRHGHSLRAVEEWTGVPFNTIRRLENGETLPMMKHAAALLRYIS
jgi:DNA-binding XRE family transcriptional regulator